MSEPTGVEAYVGPHIGVWNGQSLVGEWQVTIKIDGVRALWVNNRWLSRAGKPLLNIPPPWRIRGSRRKLNGNYINLMPGDNCELYLGSLKETMRVVHTKHLKEDTPQVSHNHLYSLDPLDPRLDMGKIINPDAAWIRAMLREVNRQGYEGLVLRQGEHWLKVKPTKSYDVLVLGMEEGTGKHKGRMGFLITHMGNVGTGFTDKDREDWWQRLAPIAVRYERPTIEVECMQLTPDGKFRHPRYLRERFDKVAEE